MKSLEENLDLEQNFLMSLSLLGDSIIIMPKKKEWWQKRSIPFKSSLLFFSFPDRRNP